ncbi:hypothetical protein, partial [Pseudomonas sp. PNPG3]|uniref:hypothetical protein n=1 Tax=Pseudomonas sp. PNPG3 TaxID=2919497 RepID=UPI001FFC361A
AFFASSLALPGLASVIEGPMMHAARRRLEVSQEQGDYVQRGRDFRKLSNEFDKGNLVERYAGGYMLGPEYAIDTLASEESYGRVLKEAL